MIMIKRNSFPAFFLLRTGSKYLVHCYTDIETGVSP